MCDVCVVSINWIMVSVSCTNEGSLGLCWLSWLLAVTRIPSIECNIEFNIEFGIDGFRVVNLIAVTETENAITKFVKFLSLPHTHCVGM